MGKVLRLIRLSINNIKRYLYWMRRNRYIAKGLSDYEMDNAYECFIGKLECNPDSYKYLEYQRKEKRAWRNHKMYWNYFLHRRFVNK